MRVASSPSMDIVSAANSGGFQLGGLWPAISLLMKVFACPPKKEKKEDVTKL